MPEIVVDASVTLAWLFDEGPPSLSTNERVAGASFIAPWMWRLEVVNVVLVKEREKVLTQAQAAGCFRFLDALNIVVVAEPINRDLQQLASFARPHQLTAYDAVYVELALTLNLPLFTHDRNQKDAATNLGIELFE